MHLRTENLVKSYKNRRVVNEVSIRVESGMAVGLLGPNGAGKTTTFYMIVGLVKPDMGKVFLGDEEFSEMPIFERARRGVCYLPQEPTVFRKLTVEENLMVILDNLKLGRSEKRARAEQVLVDLGIEKLAKQGANTLSGGERRRLEIARALILEPSFLLLDEPYAGIDPIAVIEIQGIIQKLRDRNIGIIITDHNVRETLTSCDEAYLIKEGSVWIHGKPSDIVQDESARRFYLGDNFKL